MSKLYSQVAQLASLRTSCNLVTTSGFSSVWAGKPVGSVLPYWAPCHRNLTTAEDHLNQNASQFELSIIFSVKTSITSDESSTKIITIFLILSDYENCLAELVLNIHLFHWKEPLLKNGIKPLHLHLADLSP